MELAFDVPLLINGIVQSTAVSRSPTTMGRRSSGTDSHIFVDFFDTGHVQVHTKNAIGAIVMDGGAMHCGTTVSYRAARPAMP